MYALRTYFYLWIEGTKVNFRGLQSKTLYESLVSKISTTPTAQRKYNEFFNIDTSQLDWEKIYLLAFKTTLDTKLKES